MTLIVAMIRANIPNKLAVVVLTFGIASKAPTIVIPEIAFVPDMRGVCSVGGIFVIISKPTKTAKTKAVNKLNSSINFHHPVILKFHYDKPCLDK